MEKPADNQTLSKILPDIKKEFDILNSGSFKEYEDNLNKATNKAMDALTTIIDDGTLALDPEQLVRAVQVLTKAKVDIADTRRKLMETILRGEVMMKALEPPKNEKDDNVLLEYLKKNNLNTSIGETSSNSIFGEVEKQQ